MLEIDSGPVHQSQEHPMIAIPSEALPSAIQAPPANAQAQALRVLAGQLKDLVHGSTLADAEADAEENTDSPFRDTMPAVCWAVPGAYATTVDG